MSIVIMSIDIHSTRKKEKSMIDKIIVEKDYWAEEMFRINLDDLYSLNQEYNFDECCEFTAFSEARYQSYPASYLKEARLYIDVIDDTKYLYFNPGFEKFWVHLCDMLETDKSIQFRAYEDEGCENTATYLRNVVKILKLQRCNTLYN